MKHPDLKANERELIKLIRFFSKRASRLMEAGELSSENNQLTSACENLEKQLYTHANNRSAILDKRERLEKIVEDNAKCPKCERADMLKRTGIATNANGWRSNTYRCRRCNTEFTWTKPNNPWHLAEFLEHYISELEQGLGNESNEAVVQSTRSAIEQMNDSLNRMRPVLATSDEEMAALQEKEQEMTKLIHQFKNYLLIEKIKLDAYQDPES